MAKFDRSENPDPLPTTVQKIEVFCQAMMEGCTQTEAWKKAHPKSRASQKTIYEEASRFLKDPRVAARMEEYRTELKQRHGIVVERILQEISKSAYFNIQDLFDTESGKPIPIHKLPREVAAAISEVDFDKLEKVDGEGYTFQEDYIKKLKTISKEKSWELLGRYLKMWTDQLDLGGEVIHTVRRTIVDPANEEPKNG